MSKNKNINSELLTPIEADKRRKALLLLVILNWIIVGLIFILLIIRFLYDH